MIDFILQVPALEPWHYQAFMLVIMAFVMYRVLYVITKKMNIDIKKLFSIKDYKLQRLINKERKTKQEGETLAEKIRLKLQTEENQEDILRYKKALKELEND